jgi:hypothetical protein
MKALFAALLLLGTSLTAATAQAPGPEQTYLAARDAAIKKLAAMDAGGELSKQATKFEQAAMRDLEKRMQAVIGKPALKGVSPNGKYNVEALMSGDIGFGTLDGLAYTSKDDKTRIVVSTETLASKWLADHKDWWKKLENPPQELPAAIRTEPFHTQATSAGAAVAIYAELPVTKPAAAKAVAAMLVTRRQDIGPSAPDEILVSAVQGGRVYIVSQRVEGKAKPIPACTEIFDRAMKEAEVLSEAYRASNLKDEKSLDDSWKKQEEGDIGMRKCFGDRVKSESYFGELTRMAQALLDGLPSQ